MEIYVVVGRQYGLTSVYWKTKEEANNYMIQLKTLYQDEWRIISLQAAGT